jgi:hypothetical protein
MRLTKWTALAILLATLVGRARADEPPPQGMIEIANPQPTQPLPPGMIEVPNALVEPLRAAPPVTLKRRRALFITGGVLVGVGALFTGLGAGLLVNGRQQISACRRDPNPEFLCDLGGSINESVGEILLGAGAPHLVGGLITIAFGAGEHR